MEASFSQPRATACSRGYGLCVSLKYGLVVVSDINSSQLHVYLLGDGSLVRTIGSHGSGKGQFHFSFGGLCTSPGGDSVLVAECNNDRVQEVRILETDDTSRCIRLVGVGVLRWPEYVDCNADFIVVSGGCYRMMSVLSWRTGDCVSQFGRYGGGGGPGQLIRPCGVRLLVGCPTTRLVVADSGNHRLCVFRLSGEFVGALESTGRVLNIPCDVLVEGGSFVFVNFGTDNVVKMSSAGEVVGVYGGTTIPGERGFNEPISLAALPDGGMVIRERAGCRFQVFSGLACRALWIALCAATTRPDT